jgi:hypothetical protein
LKKIWSKFYWFTTAAAFASAFSCFADEPIQASIDEDKPPCLVQTRHVQVGDGSNELSVSFCYFGTETTNSRGQKVEKFELPKQIASRLSSTNSFWAPAGETFILDSPDEAVSSLRDLGHPIISKLKLYPVSHELNKSYKSRSLPKVYLRCPRSGIVVNPMIEISGVSDQPMIDVAYDVINDSKQLLNQHGLINDEFFDRERFEFTTNYFDCDDIKLSPGTNLVRIHCYYPSGGVAVFKKLYVLRLDLKTNAPQFKIIWPVLGRQVAGNQISIRGRVDDISDRVSGEIAVNGKKFEIAGVV